jgi:hypothetical protein
MLANGRARISGDMIIPKEREVKFNAKVKLDKLPWNYIDDLFDEMNVNLVPDDKNLPPGKMDLVDADLDLTSQLTTYPFDINQLEVRKGSGKYTFADKTFISSSNFSMHVDHMHFIHPHNSGSIDGIKSLSGKFSMQKLKILRFEEFDSDMKLSGENNIIHVDFDRRRNLTNSENGILSLDFTHDTTAYQISYHVKEADLGEFLKKRKQNKFITGIINYDFVLSTSGNNWDEIKKKISGPIRISADSLVIYGFDIDDVLKKYKKSQNFNLTDLGAVLIAGPVGLAVTKGTDFVSLARIALDTSHKTVINKAHLEWEMKDLILNTKDVAVLTKNNRIAFKGSVDLNNDSIPEMTIAVVDKNGCSLIDQAFKGKIGKLEAGKINIATTILGPVINSVNAVAGSDCVPFYTGVVKNPH